MLKVIYKKDAIAGEKLESSVLKILAYFSVFDFPLSTGEIRRFLPPGSNDDCLEETLQQMIVDGLVYQLDKYYSLQNNHNLVRRKESGYTRAQELLPKAMKIGRFLCRFPYVRGIGISGSLSKMYAHEKADIDFFIITKANRLWVSRTIMHLFKKLTFLTGKQHYYCMNYFLDEKSLPLRDQNVYTAIETLTLIPVCGEGIGDFFLANGWVSEWFAGYPLMIKAQQKTASRSWIKRAVEWMLNNKFGNRLDTWLMNVTNRRWKKKEERRKLNYEGKEMSLLTGKHFAWSNPDSFQQKVIGLYHKRLAEIEKRSPEYFLGDYFESNF
jgi:hypothetical protein